MTRKFVSHLFWQSPRKNKRWIFGYTVEYYVWEQQWRGCYGLKFDRLLGQVQLTFEIHRCLSVWQEWLKTSAVHGGTGLQIWSFVHKKKKLVYDELVLRGNLSMPNTFDFKLWQMDIETVFKWWCYGPPICWTLIASSAAHLPQFFITFFSSRWPVAAVLSNGYP